MLPGRWQPVREFFDLVMAPLIEAGNAGYFAIERNGPDGKKWIVLRPESVELQAEDPALEATRLVSILCGASQGNVDPSPAGQGGCGIHYTAAALCTPKRDDKHAVALGAIVLDIDDKNVGGRAGCMAALTRIPEPSFVVHSGGGLQVGYVLREALLFDRSDDGAMRDTVYGYVRAANALGVSNLTIMRRHVLPNAMVATMTLMPFILTGSITALTSLDFLGLGLPPGSPSLGELLAQGKNNLQAPWLGLSGFVVIALMLSLLIFIGEAVRDAFDPRKAFR